MSFNGLESTFRKIWEPPKNNSIWVNSEKKTLDLGHSLTPLFLLGPTRAASLLHEGPRLCVWACSHMLHDCRHFSPLY
jgi:hypothetical protein